ncbi:hypothetical protein JOB18_014658 [Solea senegalensis]|nr:hypothetical protein JOB18_014658 [Solea senegalensis]
MTLFSTMFSFSPLVCVVALTLSVSVDVSFSGGFSGGGSSGGGSSRSCPVERKYDLSISELRDLYNSRVVKAEHMQRPLDNWSRCVGPLCHSGVRVTLEDRSTYLIHKGDDFGDSSETVVVQTRHMSDNWTVKKTKVYMGRHTVSDLVDAGGEVYKLLGANCHDAADAMMDLP